jgi:hypothetical protein
MMEWWDIGMMGWRPCEAWADFSSASLRNWKVVILEVFKTLLIIPYKRDKIPLLRFSIPVFHHSIIPGWKKKNGRVAIPYYQAFLEIPIY